MVLATRHQQVGRAHSPAGLSGVPADSYRITDVEVMPVLRPVRKIRAITEAAKYEAALMGIMTAFTGLFTADIAVAPLYIAIPGCSVIMASMFITIVVLASHSTVRHPARKR